MFFIQKMNIVLHNWTCIISVHRDVKGKQPLLLSENSHVFQPLAMPKVRQMLVYVYFGISVSSVTYLVVNVAWLDMVCLVQF